MKETVIKEDTPTTGGPTLVITIVLGIIAVVLMFLFTISGIVGYSGETLDILVWCFAIDCLLLLTVCVRVIVLQWGLSAEDEEQNRSNC